MKKSVKEVEVLFFNEYDYLSYKQDSKIIGADDLNWNHFYTKRKVKTSIFKTISKTDLYEKESSLEFIEIDNDIIIQDNFLPKKIRYSFKSMIIHQTHINRLLISSETIKQLKRILSFKELGIR